MAAGITVSRNVLINCFEGELYVVDWFGGNVDTAVCHDRLRGIWRVANMAASPGSSLMAPLNIRYDTSAPTTVPAAPIKKAASSCPDSLHIFLISDLNNNSGSDNGRQ